jgi:hypothetical protein
LCDKALGHKDKWREDESPHILTSALVRSEWAALGSDRFIPEKEAAGTSECLSKANSN